MTLLTSFVLSLVFAAEVAPPQEQSSFKVLCSTNRLLQDELCTVKVYEDRWVMFDSEDVQVGVMVKARCTPGIVEIPPNTCLKIECAANEDEASPKTEEFVLCFPPASENEFQVNDTKFEEPVDSLAPEELVAGNYDSSPSQEAADVQPDENGVIVIEDANETTEEPAQANDANIIEDSGADGSDPVITQDSTADWDEVIVVTTVTEAASNTIQTPASSPVANSPQMKSSQTPVKAEEVQGEVEVLDPISSPVANSPIIDEIQLKNSRTPVKTEEVQAVEVLTVTEQKSPNIPRPKSPSRSTALDPVNTSPIIAFSPILEDEEPIVIKAESLKLADQQVVLDSGMKDALAAQKERISYLFSNPSVQQVKVSLYLNASEWSAIAEQL